VGWGWLFLEKVSAREVQIKSQLTDLIDNKRSSKIFLCIAQKYLDFGISAPIILSMMQCSNAVNP
jgi:hypothetical protein